MKKKEHRKQTLRTRRKKNKTLLKMLTFGVGWGGAGWILCNKGLRNFLEKKKKNTFRKEFEKKKFYFLEGCDASGNKLGVVVDDHLYLGVPVRFQRRELPRRTAAALLWET